MDKDRINGIMDKYDKKIKTGTISSNIKLSYTVCDAQNAKISKERISNNKPIFDKQSKVESEEIQNYKISKEKEFICSDNKVANNSLNSTNEVKINSIKDNITAVNTNKCSINKATNSGELGSKKKVFMKIKNSGMIEVTAGCKELAAYLSSHNCNYNTKNGSWHFDPKHYEEVIRILKNSRTPYDGPVLSMVSFIQANKREENNPIKALLDKCVDLKKNNLSVALKTNPLYNTTLLPFQKIAVEFVVSRNGRAILGDDMGLGKTLQALTLALHYKLEWPLLIIAPASLLHNWHINVEKHLGITPVFNKPGSPICILSFDCATKHASILLSTQPGVIIVDECHALKSNTTQRTKSLLPLLQGSTRLLLLSGTPAVSRPVELFPLFKALDKSIFSSFDAYCVRYCGQRIFKGFRNNNGCSNAEELNYLLSLVMIRRMKAELKVEIPKKNRSVHILDNLNLESEEDSLDESDLNFLIENSKIECENNDKLNGQINGNSTKRETIENNEMVNNDKLNEQIYGNSNNKETIKNNEIENNSKASFFNDFCKNGENKLSLLKGKETKMENKEETLKMMEKGKFSNDTKKTIQEYFENAIVKIPMVCQFVDTMLSKEVKFIVFAHHSSMMEGVSNYLTEKNIKFIKIEGSTLCSNRAVFVKQFQNDDSIRVAVLSLTAANTGLTLTAAKAVVFAELYWNPGTLLQAEDRVHRIGQTEIVDIYYLLLKKSVEEKIWPSLIKKMKVLESLGISSDEYQKVK